VKTSDLLREWAWTRRRHEAWLAMFSTDPAQALIACCTALANPQSPRELFTALVDGGEFEAAELLLLDERFCAELGADPLASLAAQIEWAKRTTRAAIEIRLAHLSARADRVRPDYRRSGDPTRRGATMCRRDRPPRRPLRPPYRPPRPHGPCAARAPRGHASTLAAEEFTSWRTRSSARSIPDLSPRQKPRCLLGRPPIARPSIDVPTRPLWSFGKHTLARGPRLVPRPRAVPAMVRSHTPAAHGHDVAWQLIAGVAAWCETRGERERELLLRAFAAVMECKVLGVTRSEALGRIIRVDAPSAPGFHAFAARRWPDGLDRRARRRGPARPRRRTRPRARRCATCWRPSPPPTVALSLLAALGRQLPLAAAFVSTLADEGVRWERHDLPRDLLVSRTQSSCWCRRQGMGKTTLLRELAALAPRCEAGRREPRR
jgi:hypothetical protein